MRYADTLDVYSKLREGFEEKEAKIITLAIENAFEQADEILLKEVSTKEDIAKLRVETKEDIAKLRVEINKLEMATKEDIAKLRVEINKLEMATKEDIANLRAEIKEEISNLRAEINEEIAILEVKIEGVGAKMGVLEATLKAYIANFKTDIIKWMFLFWIGQLTVIVGLIFTLVKFLK